MTKAPKGFWIAGIVFLLWNAMGCASYIAEVSMDDIAYAERYGEGVAAMRDLVPGWSIAGYAVAVWSGLLASILFLLRRKVALPLFGLSLVGAVFGFLPLLLIDGMLEAMGSIDLFMPLLVLIVGSLEIWAARRAVAKGTLR